MQFYCIGGLGYKLINVEVAGRDGTAPKYRQKFATTQAIALQRRIHQYACHLSKNTRLSSIHSLSNATSEPKINTNRPSTGFSSSTASIFLSTASFSCMDCRQTSSKDQHSSITSCPILRCFALTSVAAARAQVSIILTA